MSKTNSAKIIIALAVRSQALHMVSSREAGL